MQGIVPPLEPLEIPGITDDPVNHPSHYTSHPSGIECIQVTRHMSFNIGNVIKYCWRAGLKDSKTDLEDLLKAQWYLNDQINKVRGMKVVESIVNCPPISSGGLALPPVYVYPSNSSSHTPSN